MDQDKETSKLAIIGNVDAGKSTLVGVLTKGILDDAGGGARERVFNYKHEKQNGRTSSIAHEIMGFDQDYKQVLPERFNANKNKYWTYVVENSKKIASFVDLCGHEKYLKTTIYGLVATVPDYSLIVVGANMGLSKMTREHLGISLFLKIPFAIVLTKVDIAPENILQDNLNQIKTLIRSPVIKRAPIDITDKTPFEDIDKWAAVMHNNNMVPIFQISSVSGIGLPQLIRFIAKTPNRINLNKAYQTLNDPMQFDIQEHFSVPGVGIVVSGLIRSGRAFLNQQVQIGPDKNKQFKVVTIKSIHVNRVQVDNAKVGDQACFCLKPSKGSITLDRADFKKGMVLIDMAIKPEPVWEFEANIHVLQHPTQMAIGYQGVLHCGVIRQAIEMQALQTKEVLRSGDQDSVRFRFKYSPEFMKPDQILVIREGRTRIFGFVTAIYGDVKNENKIEKQQIQ